MKKKKQRRRKVITLKRQSILREGQGLSVLKMQSRNRSNWKKMMRRM